MVDASLRQLSLGAAALGIVMMVPVVPAHAAPPNGGEDVTGKTLYLAPNARLRYGKSLLSRVYSNSASTLELKGDGVCTTFNCPVCHNNISLFARRVRLDIDRPASGTIFAERTLRLGDDGDDVRRVQEALVQKGYKLTLDGKFGPAMQDAVRDFQRSQGLTVDGDVGPQVYGKLEVRALVAGSDKPGGFKEKLAEKKAEIIDKAKELKTKLDPDKREKSAGLASIARTLRRGDEGADVRALQDALNNRGFKLVVDGNYGSGTQAAVREFQRKEGLSADGSVGPATLARLGAS